MLGVDLDGGVARSSCFQDPRVEVINEDATTWFVDQFTEDDAEKKDFFDVIIVDNM